MKKMEKFFGPWKRKNLASKVAYFLGVWRVFFLCSPELNIHFIDSWIQWSVVLYLGLQQPKAEKLEREKYPPWASFDKVALKVWSSFFYCPLTYKYFSYHFLLYICVSIFWETNNKYFCYHFFLLYFCVAILLWW